jgi:uncharacterized protein YidB (DUF937 family)
MGLFDALADMPGGARGRGGLSPIAMAALGLLAYKAIKSTRPQQQQTPQPQQGAPAQESGGGAGLGNILQSLGLGRPAAGASRGLGSILTEGLGGLVKQFDQAGKGDVARNWVSAEPNKPIPPADLAQVLTPDQIEFLTQKSGLSRDELLAGLSQHLPQLVDKLTPEGRIPSPQEMDRA